MLTSVSAHSALLGCQGSQGRNWRRRRILHASFSRQQILQTPATLTILATTKLTLGLHHNLSTSVNTTELSVHGKQAALLRTSDEYSHFTWLDSE